MQMTPKRAQSRPVYEHIRSITLLVKVVQYGSFRAGADALGLSPSVVSEHISSLEAHVGTILLHRSTRKLTLTDAGERLVASAQPLIATTEHMLSALTDESREAVGVLRLTMPTPIAMSPILPAISEFAQKFPGADISIEVVDHVQDFVGEGFDAAFRMGSSTAGGLKRRHLFHARCCIVGSPSYVATMPSPRKPDDLSSWQWVQHTARPSTVTLEHPAIGSETFKTKTGITANAAIAVLQLVVAGAGLAKLPHFVASTALAEGSLVEVLPDWHLPSADVNAFWSPSAPNGSLTARLVEFIHMKCAGVN